MPRRKARRPEPEADDVSLKQEASASAALPAAAGGAKPPIKYAFETNAAPEPTLTAREEQIVGYVAKGMENLEIALKLNTGEACTTIASASGAARRASWLGRGRQQDSTN